MVDAYFALKQKAIARYDIPAALAREIGRFLVTWAYFEHYVQVVIWNTLRITAEEGRIAVREPRITDRLDMICDLWGLPTIGNGLRAPQGDKGRSKYPSRKAAYARPFRLAKAGQ